MPPPQVTDDNKERGSSGQSTAIRVSRHCANTDMGMWIVPLRATVICGLYCLIGGLVYGLEQDLSAVDAIYFCIVTMSTVGYGDISPDTDGLRAFTVFWILIGIVAVFSQVSQAVTMYTNVLSEWCRDRIEKMYPPVLVDIDGNGACDFAMPESALIYYSKNLIPSVSLMFLMQFPFAAIFVGLEEEWSFGDAYYHCLVTATTVGYGDISINTEDGRICSIFQIIFSVSLLGEIISTLSILRDARRVKLDLLEQLHRKLEPNVVDNILDSAAKLHSDAGDGNELVIPAGVSKTDFVMGMLLQSGAVTWKQLQPYEELFDKAPTKEGMLGKRELAETVNEMQSIIAVAAGPGAIVVPEIKYAAPPTPPLPPTPPPPAPLPPTPPPPAPPPEITAPTDADLRMVAQEADAQLQQLGLRLVKLHVLERRIEMLTSIEFHGSKTVSAAGLQGASLEEPAVVHQICNETAVAIHVCNKVLEAHDFRTFGLLVAGHTSGKWFKHENVDVTDTPGYEISVYRAEAICAILNDEISKVAPTYQLQDQVQVESKGYGCTQPLKGFDDGKNHEENRRVEIHLLFSEDTKVDTFKQRTPVQDLMHEVDLQ